MLSSNDKQEQQRMWRVDYGRNAGECFYISADYSELDHGVLYFVTGDSTPVSFGRDSWLNCFEVDLVTRKPLAVITD